MSGFRTCLVSLPWDYYQNPSIAIGLLSASAKSKGLAVEARHLHLESAALFDLTGYAVISHRSPVFGEAICAAIVLHERREQLLAHAAKEIADAEACSDRIHDCLRHVYESYDWSAFRLIGFSLHFAQTYASLLFARWIREDHPEMRIVFGGGSVTEKLGSSVLSQFSHVDWCVHGDGEEALIRLITALQENRKRFETRVPGLIYRDGSEIRANPRAQVTSIRRSPDPDYDHYFRVRREHPGLRDRAISSYLPVEASRGCLHRCVFCPFTFENPYRPRPSSEVASSIDRLTQRYKVNSISLMALMIPPDRATRLFGLIAAQGRDYRIFCEARAGLSKPLLALMKKAGVTEVQIGIEAFDSELLQKMNKGVRLIENLQSMKFCEELGISSYSFVILGFPKETQRDVDRSVRAVDFACGFEPPREVVPYTQREGSPADRSPEKYGICWTKNVGLFSEVKYHPKEWRTEFDSEDAEGVEGIDHWFSDFRSLRAKRDYDALRHRIEKWRSSYRRARQKGQPLLFYNDCQSFLQIEDYRELEADGPSKPTPERRLSLTLEGWQRELYLFCDSVTGFAEIVARFPDQSERRIRKLLRSLVREKVMFREEDDYLSLAVDAGPACRRGVSFPWS